MNKQRKVVITITYNEMGIIIDTKAEEVAQPNLQPTCNQLATDTISRQAAIKEFSCCELTPDGGIDANDAMDILNQLPPAQPEPFVDADKLKSCRFEYINACKIVAHPTPDTSKNDIYDANAVIKALHPIFGDAEF